jgi:hypothetical protein
MDTFKRDLRSPGVLEHMKLVQEMVDDVVREELLVYPLGETEGQYPLASVFFPEVGIDSFGEPMDVAWKGLELTRKALAGHADRHVREVPGKRYVDFYSVEDTRALAKAAHRAGMEYWIAGSIRREEVADYLACGVDLICFGGAARHETGRRVQEKGGRRDESIKRGLVERLVDEFDRADPKPSGRRNDARRSSMTVTEATRDYERWLGSQLPLVRADLRRKHQQMQKDPFAFFRATYYRWVQRSEALRPPVGGPGRPGRG